MTRDEGKRPQRGRKRASASQDPAFYESLGHAIKVIRTQQRLERKDLAEAAGVSYAYLSDIETGRGRPSSGALLAIAEALGMAPHELMLAAEGNQQARRSPGIEEMTFDTVAAPSLRAYSKGAWREAARTPEVDLSPSPTSQPRVELDAALDDLDEQDLEMVLDLVHRIQGRRRDRPE